MPVAHVALTLTLFGFSALTFVSTKMLVYAQVVLAFFFIRSLSLGAFEIFSSACLQKWFVRRRGRALTAVSTAQALGISVIGLLVSWVVKHYSWRVAARSGALLNIIMVFITGMCLRSDPRHCGLLPDGDELVLEAANTHDCTSSNGDTKEGEGVSLVPQQAVASPGVFEELPSGLWQFYTFSFFFSVIYGASDFYMVGIVAESAGVSGHIDVARQIFLPLAVVQGVMSPVVGEAMDRFRSMELSFLLVGIQGLGGGIATIILCFASTPLIAMTYAILRGLAFSIHFALLNSGLVFAVMGVTPDRIGRVLGKNSMAGIAGTGVGPFCYGIANDTFGTFRRSLQVSSSPLLLLGLIFVIHACRTWAVRRRTLPADVLDEAKVKAVAVFGKSSETPDELSSMDLELEMSSD